MQTKYSKVKDYYDTGRWTAKQVENAVVKGWITTEEYYLITGLIYGEEGNA